MIDANISGHHMEGWRLKVADVVRRLFRQPDETMLETSAGGEWLVARMRAWTNPLLMMLPLANHLSGGTRNETLIGVVGVGATIVMSLLILRMARQQGRYPWLPFLSGSWDISLASAMLVLLSLHEPAGGINSMVIWGFYLISIVLTALRNDGRLVLWVGGLAFLQYAALATWVLSTRAPEAMASVGYGTAGWRNVVQRLVLISITTIVTATIVLRMQRLIVVASTDSLTGISNRSWLAYRFPRMAKRALNTGASFTVGIIDLDHFKSINDEIGHLAGDRALCHFIDIAKRNLGDNDWIVRLGGEEFAVILHTPLVVAKERIDRLREDVARSGFDPGNGQAACHFTFSAGLCSFPEDGQALDRLLGCADMRLATAKRGGRNRVVIDDSPVQGI